MTSTDRNGIKDKLIAAGDNINTSNMDSESAARVSEVYKNICMGDFYADLNKLMTDKGIIPVLVNNY